MYRKTSTFCLFFLLLVLSSETVCLAERGSKSDLDWAERATNKLISTYKKARLTNSFRPIIKGDFKELLLLAKFGRKKEAEEFLNRASQKVITIYGADSPAVASQLVETVHFYVLQDDEARALEIMEKVLKFGIRDISCGRHNALESIYRVSFSAAKNGHLELAEKLLGKVLEKQKNELPPNHCGIAKTKLNFGMIYYRNKDYPKAETVFNEYLKIRELYLGRRNATREIAPILIGILREQGKEKEAKKVEQLFSQPITPLSIEKVPMNKSDMLAEYESSKKEIPYSEKTIGILEKVIYIAERDSDWALLAKAGTERALINEQFVDKYADIYTGCIAPKHTRIDWYSYAIKAFTKQGKFLEAKKWINRALIVLPEISSQELLQLAKASNEIGEDQLAQSIATRAESAENAVFNLGFLGEFWKSLGFREKGERLQAKERKFMQDSNSCF